MKLLRPVAAALLLAVAMPACDAPDDTTGDAQDATAASGRFELFVGEDGQHYFHLLAANGARILASEGYASVSAAKSGIASVKKNGLDASRFRVLEADNGEHYWNLVAGNGAVIGTSETYGTKSAADKGAAAVRRALASAASGEAESGAVRFETLKGQDGKTYFHLRAANGQIVLQSQGYSSKSAAEKGIESVKRTAVDASRFEVFEGVDGQHTFRLVASNGAIVGRGEMFASKSNAIRSAGRVRELVRELAALGAASDDELEGEIVRAAGGLWYTSESDYPFTFVRAEGAASEITEELVRDQLGALVDADPDADKPMTELFAMESDWQEWKDAEHSCADTEDPTGFEQCSKMRGLEQVLEANLTDVRVFYFGADGEPGRVDGVGVSVFIVGRTPEGHLAGVRTLAIWT